MENAGANCRSSKLNLRRIDGPYLQRMPPASGCSVVSDRDGLRSIARCNSIHPTVAVIRPWPASVAQLSARCTDDEDRRCEARPEVGVVRSGVAQPAGPPALSSPGRCACGLPGNRRYIRAPVAGGVDRSAGLRDQALHGEHCRPSAPFCHGLRTLVRMGFMELAWRNSTTSPPNLVSRSNRT